MPRWWRVIRGMIGMGLTFAVGVGVVASVIAVPMWLLSGGDSGREIIRLVVASSIWAFPVGVAFSGVLALTARGRPFDRLSLPASPPLVLEPGFSCLGFLASTPGTRGPSRTP